MTDTTLPIEALVDHIERTHHLFTRAEFARLGPLLRQVVLEHGARHPELAEVAIGFANLVAEVEPHMVKEERVLFPAIRAGGSSDVEPPIRVMELEHADVTNILRDLRSSTRSYEVPLDASGAYRALYEGLAALEADLVEHIRVEDEELFPRALALAE